MKIALVMADGFSLWQPRRGLIRWLLSKGHEVYAISTPDEYIDRIKQLGAIHIPVEMDRCFNPIHDLAYLRSLIRIFKTHRFDIVNNLTTKPNIYGAIAARLAGVPKIVGSVEGLGQGLMPGSTWKSKAMCIAARQLYRLACRLSHKMRFMNTDDLEYFVSHKLIDQSKAVLIVGEGVNLAEYSPDLVNLDRVQALKAQLHATGDMQFVTMVARANWYKGVRQFIEASKIVSRKCDSVKFVLVGTIDEGAAAVPREYLKEQESRHFQWVGFVQDLREVFLFSKVVVLPSYYREGTPNALIEAMAMNKPVVTTDNVGCREVVENGRNGYLVPVKDSDSLANAIGSLLDNPERLNEFGRQSRLMVEDKFDEQKTFHRIFSELYCPS